MDKFVEDIQCELDKGYGFNFLLGSGISYQSGVMLGSEIGNYLSYVYYKILIADQDKPLWTIPDSGWPAIPKEAEKKECINAIIEEYIDVCESKKVTIKKYTRKGTNEVERLVLEKGDYVDGVYSHSMISSTINRPLCPQIIPREIRAQIDEEDEEIKRLWVSLKKNSNFVFHNVDNTVPSSDSKLIREAGIRSLYDWRATLEFLARLKLDKGEKNFRLSPNLDQDIVDSFNRFMVGNRKPNQNHYLITHLSRPLRTRKLFTTNFDTLTEDAFRRDKQPIKVLTLEVGGNLPSPDLIRPSLSLLKLHGESRNTRADFSIDEKPTERDKETFIEYLCPQGPRRTLPSHLIVVGSSLADKRILKLIINVLDKRESFKVFIIANSERDVKNFTAWFAEHYKKDCIGSSVIISPPGRSEYTLYDLYQRLTLSLPPGGFFYQFDQNLPPALPSTENGSIPDIDLTLIEKKLDKYYPILCERKILGITGKYGVTRVSSHFFTCLVRKGYRCMWFELEDFSRPEDLASEIVRSILNEIGKFQLEHVVTGFTRIHEFSVRLARYIEYTRITPEKWVIFIYGRNLPGECAGFNDQVWRDSDNVSNKDKLVVVINTLLSNNFKVVFMPFDQQRRTAIESNRKTVEKRFGIKYYEESVTAPLENSGGSENRKIEQNVWSSADLKRVGVIGKNNLDVALGRKYEEIEKVIKNLGIKFDQSVNERAEEDRKRARGDLRYFYVSTLFRQSRHLSALISEATIPCKNRFNTIGKDNDKDRSKRVLELRKELIKQHVIRIKPGGYVWKYGDIRHGMKEVLQSSKAVAKLFGEVAGDDAHVESCSLIPLISYRADSHLLIADWYLKAFMSTGHPTPFMEAMYHLFSAIRFCKYARHIHHTEINPRGSSERLLRYRYSILVISLTQVNKALYLARTNIKRWMYDTNNEVRFSEAAIMTALFDSFDGKQTLKVDMEMDSGWMSTWLMHVLGVNGDDISKFNLDGGYIRSMISDLLGQSRSIDLDLAVEAGRATTDIKYANAAGVTTEISLISKPTFRRAMGYVKLEQCEIYQANKKHALEERIDILSEGMDEQSKVLLNELGTAIRTYISDSLAVSLITGNDKPIVNELEKLRNRLDKDVTRIKVQSIIAFSFNLKDLLAYVSLISDLAYVYVKWAKMIARVEGRVWNITPNAKGRPRFSKSLWVVVCVFCAYGLALLKLVSRSSINEELALRAKYSSLYGLALGRLGRFCEAHRRLNEANSMDFNFSERIGSNISASVGLRRAEVSLYEAIYHLDVKKDPKDLKYIALLDDVYVGLKRSEYLLSGINHSSLWWGRLHMLRLRLYGVYQPESNLELRNGWVPLMYREKRDYYEFVKSCFIKGFLVSPNNAYRRLCYIHYFLEALKSVEVFHKKFKVRRHSYKVLEILREVACLKDEVWNSLPADQLILRLLTDDEKSAESHGFKGYAAELFNLVVEQMDFALRRTEQV